MSFGVQVIGSIEYCDKCGKIRDDMGPLLEIREMRRAERNIIFVHEYCLRRSLTTALSRAEEEKESA